MTAALLHLADGRLPAGGHAHSGGLEAAIEAGSVRDLASTADFVLGRLHTAGAVAAALAARACVAAGHLHTLAALDVLADARMPSPAQRASSRSQGRALIRVASAAWPWPSYPELGMRPHHPVAVGTVAWVAGLEPVDAARVAAAASVSGPASAAVRLLGLDPIAVAALQARLGPAVDAVAARAADDPEAHGPEDLASAPMLDVLAERHAVAPVTMFAS